MRIVIGGAGAVGRSVARELVDNGHKVLLIEQKADHFDPRAVPGAEWLLADACELATLEECGLRACDALIAATGDDRANLSMALMAKTEFAVPLVVARVNDSHNEWLFTGVWGVDIAVSTPRAIVGGVEGAIDVGHLVHVMGLRQSQVNLTKLTLPHTNSWVGQRVRDVVLPENTALVVVLREDTPILPRSAETLAPGDELLFAVNNAAEHRIRAIIEGGAGESRHPEAASG